MWKFLEDAQDLLTALVEANIFYGNIRKEMTKRINLISYFVENGVL